MAAVQDPIERLERKLRRLEDLIGQREVIATAIIEDEIVNEIKAEMYAANYSIRILDNVELREVKIGRKKINYKIFNELIVGDGFDIAEGREKGIRPHDIFGNPVLVWQGQTIIGTPTTIFATHVKHPGVAATHIIQDTIRQNNPIVQARYKETIQNEMRQIRNSS